MLIPSNWMCPPLECKGHTLCYRLTQDTQRQGHHANCFKNEILPLSFWQKWQACGFEEKQLFPNKRTNCCFCGDLTAEVPLRLMPPRGGAELAFDFARGSDFSPPYRARSQGRLGSTAPAGRETHGPGPLKYDQPCNEAWSCRRGTAGHQGLIQQALGGAANCGLGCKRSRCRGAACISTIMLFPSRNHPRSCYSVSKRKRKPEGKIYNRNNAASIRAGGRDGPT